MKSTILAALLAIAPSAALAQAGGGAILDQGRADRMPPSATPAGPLSPRSSAATSGAQGPDQTVQPFVLARVQIKGGSLPPEILRPAWSPFVGKRVGAAELKALADAVSEAYGRSDVALYTVVTPRQTFGAGWCSLM
ncbi:MAG: POTRA domain-containing protein [Caulobacteraceae bacterium]